MGQATLRYYRSMMLIAPVVYLAWWTIVHFALPASFNPLGSRLFICALFVVALAATYASGWARRHAAAIHTACALVLTTHYFYLYAHNPVDPNWVVGSFVTVLVVGITLERRIDLLALSLLVIVASAYIAAHDPSNSVGLPGVGSVVALINLVAFLRRKADSERQLRLAAEVDRATAEAADKAKTLFLANMSHELRTPISCILGFSHLLTEDANLTADSRDMLDRVAKNAYVLLDLVNKILTLTDSEIILGVGARCAIDLRTLIETHVTAAKAAAAAKAVAVTLQLVEPFDATALADGQVLGQALDCVLSNAVKYTKAGSVDVEASVDAAESADQRQLTIRVRDTGIGIEPAKWEAVFAPFTQASPGLSRPYGGSGIGLTVARRLARLSGGEVVIEASEPGRGTCVRLTFQLPRGG